MSSVEDKAVHTVAEKQPADGVVTANADIEELTEKLAAMPAVTEVTAVLEDPSAPAKEEEETAGEKKDEGKGAAKESPKAEEARQESPETASPKEEVPAEVESTGIEASPKEEVPAKEESSKEELLDKDDEPAPVAEEKPRVRVFGSTVSGNRIYKKQIKDLFLMLDANEIEYDFVCIAADQVAKRRMKVKSLGNMTIPQIHVDGEFKGCYDDAFKANEIDELYEWLGLDEDPVDF
ncbi:hypothetical protein EC988_002483 [Linderina pennispora]|nr:hypothetical protein EC988_002483 [Linderina pennispora]